jgi:hypothetical protein
MASRKGAKSAKKTRENQGTPIDAPFVFFAPLREAFFDPISTQRQSASK